MERSSCTYEVIKLVARVIDRKGEGGVKYEKGSIEGDEKELTLHYLHGNTSREGGYD